MKKCFLIGGTILLLVVLLFCTGIFSTTVSLGDFFFASSYYDTAEEAYLAGSTYDVERTIGTATLNNEAALFLGELDESCFVVAELVIKDNQYAFEGTTTIYEIQDGSDGYTRNQTDTPSGTVEWAILYSQAEVDAVSNAATVETFKHSSGNKLYLVIFQ